MENSDHMHKGIVHAHGKSWEAVLAYGMGPNKLMDAIECTQQEAKDLIEEYFKTFPSIKKFLDHLGRKAVSTGASYTYPPFRRRRKFPEWHPSLGRQQGDFGTIGKIERAGKNSPIQGTSADMTKLALVYVRRLINRKYGNDKVRLVMTVHDQIDTICKRNIAEQWKEDLNTCMEKAGLAIIRNGLLKADTNITEAWSK